MPHRHRVIYLLGKLLPGLLAFAATAVLTRLLDPAEYGLYGLAMTIILFVSLTGFEWLGLSLLRFLPSAAEPARLLGTVAGCFAACALVCAGATGLIAAAGAGAQSSMLIAAAAAAAVGSALVELNAKLMIIRSQPWRFFAINGVRGALALGLGAAAARAGWGAVGVTAATLCAMALAGLAFNQFSWRSIRASFDRALLPDLLRYGLPYSVGLMAASLLLVMDRWMIAALADAGAVGLFSAAYALAQMPILVIAGGLGQAAYPQIVEAVDTGDSAGAKRGLEHHLIFFLAAILPTMAGIALLAEPIARVFLGPAFVESAIDLMPWLAAGAAISVLRGYYIDLAFQLARRTQAFLVTIGLTLLANMALNWLLIPRYGLIGAGYANFGASLFGLAIGFAASRRYYRLPWPWRDMLRIAAALLLMAAGLRAIPMFARPAFVALAIAFGAILYGAAIVMLDTLGLRRELLRHRS